MHVCVCVCVCGYVCAFTCAHPMVDLQLCFGIVSIKILLVLPARVPINLRPRVLRSRLLPTDLQTKEISLTHITSEEGGDKIAQASLSPCPSLDELRS